MQIFESIPDVLEVTLRDGSYLIDFQFTAHDTATIAAALESAGFRWIELGHGLGLHAAEAGHGSAAATEAAKPLFEDSRLVGYLNIERQEIF
jgi:isopropylmalate/homocitrate/citramalate synthase